MKMSAGHVFTAEQLKVMHAALERICENLISAPVNPPTEQVAVTIVDLAAAGVLEFDGITEATLAAVAQWQKLDAVNRKTGERAA
jgi:hypothetical protein